MGSRETLGLRPHRVRRERQVHAAVIAVVLLLVAPTASVAADPVTDPAYLLKDISPRGGSGPHGFTQVGDSLFFVAKDADHGVELWKTDGTEAGTVLVKDIQPGSRDSYPGWFTAVGDLLFFRAETRRHGYELWKSDGTSEGTVLVQDINPGKASSMRGCALAAWGPTGALQDTFLFRANDGETGCELWKSDGTAAGTSLLKDIWPGRHESFPNGLTGFGSEVYFAADDSLHGEELWKTDGTTEGTVLVKDINPGPDRSTPVQMTPVAGALYFAAEDGTHGWELWRTDGTEAGTQLLLDIRPGADSSVDSPPSGPWVALGQTLLFPATDGQRGMELWRSDGTSGGTRIVADLVPGSSGVDPEEMTVVDETTAYFFGWGNKSISRTDGTEQGTIPVVRVGVGVYVGSNWRTLCAVGTTVFFESMKDDYGYELWMTDGTPDGSGLAADVNPGPDSSTPRSLFALGTTLLFSAQDGEHGRELWAFPTTT